MLGLRKSKLIHNEPCLNHHGSEYFYWLSHGYKPAWKDAYIQILLGLQRRRRDNLQGSPFLSTTLSAFGMRAQK